MIQSRKFTEAISAVSLLALLSAPALADTHHAKLIGLQEVPAISSPGEGLCRVQINHDETTVTVNLSYSDVAGVTQAHIHFGQKSVNGGIVLFLCSNLGNGPAGTPACPASPGVVERVLVSGDVVPVAAQGIAAGELAEVIDAIRAGTAYCNVHSSTFAGG
ncbi:MAG: CHRD domain-containing protein, partial [Deltaproteobacteria bacterium]|nr:CHRD domain-containing protein [Deltaproteobacteria bacterium]